MADTEAEADTEPEIRQLGIIANYTDAKEGDEGKTIKEIKLETWYASYIVFGSEPTDTHFNQKGATITPEGANKGGNISFFANNAVFDEAIKKKKPLEVSYKNDVTQPFTQTAKSPPKSTSVEKTIQFTTFNLIIIKLSAKKTHGKWNTVNMDNEGEIADPTDVDSIYNRVYITDDNSIDKSTIVKSDEDGVKTSSFYQVVIKDNIVTILKDGVKVKFTPIKMTIAYLLKGLLGDELNFEDEEVGEYGKKKSVIVKGGKKSKKHRKKGGKKSKKRRSMRRLKRSRARK